MTKDSNWLYANVSFDAVKLLDEVAVHGKRLPGVYHSVFDVKEFMFCKRIDLFCVAEPGKRLLFIDTGNPLLTGTAALDQAVSRFEVPWEDATVLLTHFHEDHDGNVPYCLNRGVHDFYAGPLQPYDSDRKKKYLRLLGAEDLHSDDLDYQLDLAMAHKPSALSTEEYRLTCQGQELLPMGDYLFEVVPTPGHTREHICLLERSEKLLFAGDHIVDAPPGIMQFDVGQNLVVRYIENLRMLRNFNLEAVFMSHHEPLYGASVIHPFIEMIIGRYESALTATFEMVKNAGHALSARQAAEIRASKYKGGLAGFPASIQARRIAMMFANLEGLCDIGRFVRSYDDAGHVLYGPKRHNQF